MLRQKSTTGRYPLASGECFEKIASQLIEALYIQALIRPDKIVLLADASHTHSCLRKSLAGLAKVGPDEIAQSGRSGAPV